jgi:hypothetical protein
MWMFITIPCKNIELVMNDVDKKKKNIGDGVGQIESKPDFTPTFTFIATLFD